MLKHLVLAVDYSSEWDQAMQQLPQLTKLLGTEKITLTYVLKNYNRFKGGDSEASAGERLRKVSEQLASNLGVETQTRVAEGFVAREVLAVARKEQADGVIACNRSHKASKELFFGNSALNLARMTHLPLVIIPLQEEAPAAEDQVLFATDGSQSSEHAQAAFEQLMAENHPGHVVWVHGDEATAEDDAIEQRLNDLTERYPQTKSQVRVGRAPEQVLQCIENTRPALTIIGKRGATPIAELMLGSTAEHVTSASRFPVLLVP